LACEPRHASWFTPRAEDLFACHGVSRVGADPPRVPGGDTPLASGHWRYWRWHGSPRIYYSEYDEAALRALADDLRTAKGPGQRWVIFDNTAHGFAVANAVRLRELVAGAGSLASALPVLRHLQGVFAEREACPRWMGDLVDSGQARATGLVRGRGDELVCDQVEASNDRIGMQARLRIAGGKPDGDLYARWGVLGMGVELQPGEQRKLHLAGARNWYESRPALL